MNPLYDAFPESVQLCGREYPIATDFRDWLRFYDMLRDPEGTQREKVETMLSFYLADVPLLAVPMAHKPLIRFFRARELEETAKEEQENLEDDIPQEPHKPVFDYAFDAPYIIAGFWQDYGLDLMDPELAMHWWKFRVLLTGLSERTEFKQRIMYRNTNTADIKNVKERQRIERIQRRIAIPSPAPTDEEMGDLFW